MYEGVFWKKCRNYTLLFFDEIDPLFSIEVIEGGLFRKYLIPVGEVSGLCYTFADFFQECIALGKNLIIFAFHAPKLPKGTCENPIDEVPTSTGCKIEEIHIKWGEKHCPIGKLMHIFHSRDLRSLDMKNILPFPSFPREGSHTDRFTILELEERIFCSRSENVVDRTTTCEVYSLKNVGLS